MPCDNNKNVEQRQRQGTTGVYLVAFAAGCWYQELSKARRLGTEGRCRLTGMIIGEDTVITAESNGHGSRGGGRGQAARRTTREGGM